MMYVARFRFFCWIGGFVGIAENIAIILSFGFWLPCWSTRYKVWQMMSDY